MRPYQVGTAAAIVLIAAVAMFDSRRVLSPAPGAAVAGYQALTRPQPKEGVFAGAGSVAAVAKLVIPMLLYAVSFAWLGFYLATGVYMGFFAAYIGRYKPWWSLASAVLTPLAIYLLFEVGFRLILPRSIFYPGIPF